ncbi:MAG TPA: O-antigen ligase family protein [Bryobacteraceae bacterium]|nr:O-antigen ligase family protein [Bryobacteraceae bacterium]HOQ44526.1 O-antigen ligase family protein [Bryobacteraceae bacterium]HPQ13613.1 O-antigen ligase family protein [Bryobacteraceae bacterium]HPU70845.1 O-antigen ligase family protein [Bryobacteraceae bacterium]
MFHLGLEPLVNLLFPLVCVAGFLLSIFWNPRIGLYVLVPLLPLQTVRYRLHAYPLGTLFVDLMLLGILLGLKRVGLPAFPKTGFNRILAVYTVFTYVWLWRGMFHLGSAPPLWFDDRRLQDWKNYVVMFLLMFLTVSAIRTKRQMQLLLLAMAAGVFLLDKYYLATMSGRDFSQFSYATRYAGAMGYAGENGFAAFQAQIGTFLLGFLLSAPGLLAKTGAASLLGMTVLCLLYALSRGGYAAFLFGCLFLGVTKNRLILAGLVAFLVSWQALVPPAVRERVYMTVSEEGLDSSAASRLGLWEEAMQVFDSNPVIGTGFNTYAYRENPGGFRDTHNMYVKVLVETGVIGISIFLWLLWKMYRAGRRLYKTGRDPFFRGLGLAFAGLMASAALVNFFGDRWTYLQVSGYTFVLLGLVVRAQQIEDEEEEEEHEETGPERLDEAPSPVPALWSEGIEPEPAESNVHSQRYH